MTFETKEEAHEAMELSNGEWLDQARGIARFHCMEYGKVTIDDVRRKADPIPDGADPRLYGAVFNKEFRKVGSINSTRKTCHKRPISVFELA